MRISKALFNKYAESIDEILRRYFNIGHNPGKPVVLWHYNPKTGFEIKPIDKFYITDFENGHIRNFNMDDYSFRGRYDPVKNKVSIITPHTDNLMYNRKTLDYVKNELRSRFGNDLKFEEF